MKKALGERGWTSLDLIENRAGGDIGDGHRTCAMAVRAQWLDGTGLLVCCSRLHSTLISPGRSKQSSKLVAEVRSERALPPWKKEDSADDGDDGETLPLDAHSE